MNQNSQTKFIKSRFTKSGGLMNIDNIINSITPKQNKESANSKSRHSSANSAKSRPKSNYKDNTQDPRPIRATNQNISGNYTRLSSPKDIMQRKIDKSTILDVRKREQNTLQDEWNEQNMVM